MAKIGKSNEESKETNEGGTAPESLPSPKDSARSNREDEIKTGRSTKSGSSRDTKKRRKKRSRRVKGSTKIITSDKSMTKQTAIPRAMRDKFKESIDLEEV